jgi:uncharacterized protein
MIDFIRLTHHSWPHNTPTASKQLQNYIMARWRLVGLLTMQILAASAFTTSKVLMSTAAGRRSFHSSSSLAAIRYLLRYDYIPDVLEKRGPYREGHLNLAKKLIDEGTCLSGGPTGEPKMEVPTGALFIFTDLEAAKLFVKEDPYTQNGIVTGHSIQEWNVVVQKE